MSAEVVRVLRDARALIDTPEKWVKGTPLSGSGQFCALIAVSRAGGSVHGLASIALRTVIAAGCAIEDLAEISIVDWNDAPGTTHTDVMAAFDKAIQQEES